jgi:hypothetical protein
VDLRGKKLSRKHRICITTLSVVQTRQHQIIGRLMNEELEKLWKEVAVTYFRATIPSFTWNG